MALIDFLKTETSTDDIATALKVIREFKRCEGIEEYLRIPLIAWAKFEQLEEFLAHIAEGAELQEDTKKVLAYQQR